MSPKKAEYHGALQRAVEVRPIIHETYGGLQRTASQILREMAGGARRAALQLDRRLARENLPPLPPLEHLVCAGEGARF